VYGPTSAFNVSSRAFSDLAEDANEGRFSPLEK
jgi:hypothetical protein